MQVGIPIQDQKNNYMGELIDWAFFKNNPGTVLCKKVLHKSVTNLSDCPEIRPFGEDSLTTLPASHDPDAENILDFILPGLCHLLRLIWCRGGCHQGAIIQGSSGCAPGHLCHDVFFFEVSMTL